MLFIVSEKSWHPILISFFGAKEENSAKLFNQFLFAIWSMLSVSSRNSCLQIDLLNYWCQWREDAIHFLQRVCRKQIWSLLLFGVKQGKELSICIPFLLGSWSCLFCLFLVYNKGDAVNFFKKSCLWRWCTFLWQNFCWFFDLFCFQCQFLKELLFAIRCLSIALHVFQGIRGTSLDIT